MLKLAWKRHNKNSSKCPGCDSLCPELKVPCYKMPRQAPAKSGTCADFVSIICHDDTSLTCGLSALYFAVHYILLNLFFQCTWCLSRRVCHVTLSSCAKTFYYYIIFLSDVYMSLFFIGSFSVHCHLASCFLMMQKVNNSAILQLYSQLKRFPRGAVSLHDTVSHFVVSSFPYKMIFLCHLLLEIAHKCCFFCFEVFLHLIHSQLNISWEVHYGTYIFLPVL